MIIDTSTSPVLLARGRVNILSMTSEGVDMAGSSFERWAIMVRRCGPAY
jgi:hypothetical protein